MYGCRGCMCGKRGEGESACIAVENVPAEREGRARSHVPLRE